MVLASNTLKLQKKNQYNEYDGLQNEIDSIVEKNEKELNQMQESIQNAENKTEEIVGNLEETNNKIDNIKIEMDTNIGEINSKFDGLQITVENSEGQITEVTQTVQGIQTTVQDNTGKITEITQTTEGLNSKVQSNSNTLDGVDSNLIESYDVTPTLSNTGNGFERESVNENGWATFTDSSFKSLNNVKFKDEEQEFVIKENTQYTLSFEVNTNCDIFENGGYIRINVSDSIVRFTKEENVIEETEEQDVVDPEKKSMKYRIKYTFTPVANFIYPNLSVKTTQKLKSEYSDYPHVSFRRFQIFEGVEVKDWGKQGGLKDKYTEVTQTVEGIQTTISNQDGRITTLKQTVDGMKSTVQNNSNQITSVSQSVDGVLVKVEDNKQKIGQLTITSQNLQSNITNLENNTNSKISQLSDNINLRVEKDEIINQINISEEGIAIDGSKVKITGQTYIENGVIKDAMIENLSANKIRTGKIIGGSLTFNLDEGKIYTTNEDERGMDLTINNGGLMWGAKDVIDASEVASINARYEDGISYKNRLDLSANKIVLTGRTGYGGAGASLSLEDDIKLKFYNDFENGLQKEYSLQDVVHKTYSSYNTLNSGKFSKIVFPDGRTLKIENDVVRGANVGKITGVNGVGIAWSGGDLYFKNQYRDWVKLEDLLRKIKF